MKTIHKQIKLITMLLSVAVMLQSCNIYKSSVSTVDEAVQSKNWVKIKSSNNENYKFKELFIVDETLYGSAKSKSKTAESLKDQIVAQVADSKFVHIKLMEQQLGEVHELNEVLTTLSPIFIIGGAFIVYVGGLFLAIAIGL